MHDGNDGTLFNIVMGREASMADIILTAFECGAVILVGDVDAVVSRLDVEHRLVELALRFFRPFGRAFHKFVKFLNLIIGHAEYSNIEKATFR
jgi:hypothetical protein